MSVIIFGSLGYIQHQLEHNKAECTVLVDDLTGIDAPVFTGLTNGDFETGTLNGWYVYGGASISTLVVHDGTYSCHLPSYAGIIQRFEPCKQIDIYVNIVSGSGYLTFIIYKPDLSIDRLFKLPKIKDGWFCYRINADIVDPYYKIGISSFNVDAYIDSIQVKQEHDTAVFDGSFDIVSWYNTPVQGTSISTYMPYGISSTPCLYLDTGDYTPNRIAGASCKYDMTNIQSLVLSYKIPQFTSGTLKCIITQGDITIIDSVIAQASGGPVDTWTEHVIDTSNLLGIYTIYVYAESLTSGTCKAYIDNVHIVFKPINITTMLYAMTVPRVLTDRGHILNDITDLGVPICSNMYTVNGEPLLSDSIKLTSQFASFVSRVIHVLTYMAVKIRRVAE